MTEQEKVATTPMKVAQVPEPGADFQIVEREIPTPGAGHVRIKVQACGVCHSDVLTKDGSWPGIQYPRVPGHEVVGIIDELGAGVSEWKRGSGSASAGTAATTAPVPRVGAEILSIAGIMKIAGISYDGGYQEYMVAPVEALAAIPESLNDVEAAPLLCAGITTFNALRHSGASPATLLRCKVSAVWATSEFNLRTSLVIRSRLSGAAPKTRRSQRSSERACTLIAKRRTQQRSCKNWAGHKSF